MIVRRYFLNRSDKISQQLEFVVKYVRWTRNAFVISPLGVNSSLWRDSVDDDGRLLVRMSINCYMVIGS